MIRKFISRLFTPNKNEDGPQRRGSRRDLPRAQHQIDANRISPNARNTVQTLQQAGFDFQVIEKLDAVGGNWLENTYPGAAVDTPSRVYSFSFEPNASWTRYYPVGPEFLAYLERVTDRYNLRERVTFNTTVEGAEWDEERKLWKVNALQDGNKVVFEGQALIMAVGPNNAPNYPDVAHLDTFAGPVIHSAAWDHSVDLKGKKAVLVGTGCSGV